MNGIYLLLGSNLGDRLANFQRAIDVLKQKGVRILRYSPVYETVPWGIRDQPNFLNAVIEVQTEATPQELLQMCLDTEIDLGRIRRQKWGARIIDIDVLLFHSLVLNESNLIIPHPGVTTRRFTLLPLCEMISNEVYPGTQLTFADMMTLLPDEGDCQKTDLVLTI
jgi:2-amino-4-hydroxy-6-hydroxymethyldihydropteridine diphosphokinase